MGKNEEGRDMSKELIKRLRADAESTDDIGLCADAAERIEELKRERDQLRAELEAARADAKEAWEKLGEQCIAHTATIQKLAAEQAKNVELLEIAKKGLRHYENRNIAHGTRNPAAIALDEIAATPSDTSALEAIIERAGEVMREQCADYLDRYGEVSQRRSEEIRALPAVTLEDLK